SLVSLAIVRFHFPSVVTSVPRLLPPVVPRDGQAGADRRARAPDRCGVHTAYRNACDIRAALPILCVVERQRPRQGPAGCSDPRSTRSASPVPWRTGLARFRAGNCALTISGSLMV